MNKYLVLVTLLSLGGCSNNPIQRLFEKEKPKVLVKVQKKLVSGPTQNVVSTFKDVTKGLGLDNLKAINLYAVDFNNDSYTDLIVLPEQYSSPIFLVFDIKNKIFKKIRYNPFSEIVRGSFLIFNDFNKDGVNDLIVGTLNQKTELTKFPLRFFKGASAKGFIQYIEIHDLYQKNEIKATSSISLLDYDLDGNIDIFEANWFDLRGKRPKILRNRILKGSGFKFKDVSYILEGELKYSSPLKSYVNARPTFGSSICDVDQNGYPDVLTSNSTGYSNKMLLNRYDHKNKDRIFKDYAKTSGSDQDDEGRMSPKGGGNSFFSLCTDYNNNGIVDILNGELSHSYDSEQRDRSSFLTGKRLKFPPLFIRSEYLYDGSKEVWSQADKRANWIDVNNDGLTDILVDNSGFPDLTRLVLFKQANDHGFDDKSKATGIDILNPSGTITIDFNNDGKMDFISGQSSLRNSKIKRRIYAFQNVSANNNRALRVYLSGKKSNPSAIGAMIQVDTEKFSQKRFVNYSYGPLPAQNEEGIHFGISKGNKLLSAKVSWPILGKNKSPLIRNYNLSKLKFSKYLEVTLCENGKVIPGKVVCK